MTRLHAIIAEASDAMMVLIVQAQTIIFSQHGMALNSARVCFSVFMFIMLSGSFLGVRIYVLI